MYTLVALLISLPFAVYGVYLQSANQAWFAGLKKPPTYPVGGLFTAMCVVYSAMSIAALIVANIDQANAGAAWLFILMQIVCAVMTVVGFSRRNMMLATVVAGVYYALQLCAIVVNAFTSWFAAGLVALCSLWTLYSIYAGFYMAMSNRTGLVPRARVIKKAE